MTTKEKIMDIVKPMISECIENDRYYYQKVQMIYKVLGTIDVIEDTEKNLQHHYDSTVGLWATDRPEMIPEELKKYFSIIS